MYPFSPGFVYPKSSFQTEADLLDDRKTKNSPPENQRIYNLQTVVFCIVMFFFGGCTSNGWHPSPSRFDGKKHTTTCHQGTADNKPRFPRVIASSAVTLEDFVAQWTSAAGGRGVKKVRKGNCKMDPQVASYEWSYGVHSHKLPYKWVTGGFCSPLISGVMGHYLKVFFGGPLCGWQATFLPFIWEMQSARLTGPLFIAIFSWPEYNIQSTPKYLDLLQTCKNGMWIDNPYFDNPKVI